MDWKPVVDIVVTAVFLLGIGLALWGLLTVHRSPYFFPEVQKLSGFCWCCSCRILAPWFGFCGFVPSARRPHSGSWRRRSGTGSAREAGEVAARGRVVRVQHPTPTIKVTKVTPFQLDSASRTPYSSMCCLR